MNQHIASQIWRKAFDRGLIVYYSQGCADGVNGDIVMLGPPLVIEEKQIDELVAILSAAFDDQFK
jgi:adenosylmethionine-8-amino-7-oxononanoate aminotransferase